MDSKTTIVKTHEQKIDSGLTIRYYIDLLTGQKYKRKVYKVCMN